jgi:hypothetical protein
MNCTFFSPGAKDRKYNSYRFLIKIKKTEAGKKNKRLLFISRSFTIK